MLFLSRAIGALVGSKDPGNSINLEFPLKSQDSFYILQGGNSHIINHHYLIDPQKYAIDVVKLNSFGIRSKNFIPYNLNDYNIFQSTVYSPCNGEILQVVDQFKNCKPFKVEKANPGGNHIVIRSKDDSSVKVILAHLQEGSFMVKTGEFIQAGTPLAKVGNSGHTTEPHLHIQARNSTDDVFFTGEGVSMRFNNKFLIRNDLFKNN